MAEEHPRRAATFGVNRTSTGRVPHALADPRLAEGRHELNLSAALPLLNRSRLSKELDAVATRRRLQDGHILMKIGVLHFDQKEPLPSILAGGSKLGDDAHSGHL